MEVSGKILISVIILPIILSGCNEDSTKEADEQEIQLVSESYDEISKLYMEDFQVSEEEAKYRLNIMSKNNLILNQLLEKYGESNISAFYFDNTSNEFGAVLHTTLEEDDTQLLMSLKDDLNNSFDFPIEIKNNYPMNTQEMSEYLGSKENDLTQAVSGIQGYSYDPKKEAVEIDIYNNERSRLNKSNDVDRISKIIPDMNISLNYLSEPLKVSASANPRISYGGAQISSTDGTCTIGFPANISGYDGFITARHCIRGGLTNTSYPSLVAINPDDSRQFLYLGSQDLSFNTAAKHDLMFITADDAQSTPYIFTGTYSTTKQPLYLPIKKVIPRMNTATPSVYQTGTYVCKYGKSTFQTCGEVTTTTYNQLNVDNGCALKINSGNSYSCDNTFVKVKGRDEKFCAVGDSGGPVYGVTTNNYGYAYGVVSSCLQQDKTFIYSSLDYITALGASAYVKTVS